MNTPDLRYPLHYPGDRPRTPAWKRESARFEVGFAQARDELIRELELLGATDIVISTNVQLRRDGLPYANFREPQDPGVAVYFKYNKTAQCIACDGWNKVKDNLRDIGLAIQNKRALVQNRKSVTVEQEFRGYQALPAGARQRQWWEVLGVSQHATWDEVKEAYRDKAKLTHPDAGGDRQKWDELQRAYEQAAEALSQKV